MMGWMPMTRRVAVLTAAVMATGLAFVDASFAAPYDDDTVIVKYAAGSSRSDRQAVARDAGGIRTVGPVSGVGAEVLEVDRDPADAARRLNSSPLVVYAEPNFILKTQAIPNDGRFGELYGLNNTGQTGGSPDADIDAPEGWGLAAGGAFPSTGGTKVGIIDTGIDKNHEDLSGKTVNCARSIGLIFPGTISEGSCSDDNDHGTHVAGTVAAKANNGVGIAGVGFNSPLAICKALNSVGYGLTGDIANCINWVYSKGAKVISMSFGGPSSTTLRNAVQNVWKGGAASGAVLVAAAGNDGNSTVNYPAGYGEVVSVGATDDRDRRASFSNANSDVEAAAPGVAILSTKRGGGYVRFSGTSMATPHVSAVAAGLRQLFPSSTASSIRSKLDAAVDDLGATGRDTSFGFGRVNVCKAVGGSCPYTGGG